MMSTSWRTQRWGQRRWAAAFSAHTNKTLRSKETQPSQRGSEAGRRTRARLLCLAGPAVPR